MAGITFQKLYKITVGQLLSDGSIRPLVILTENRFTARIRETAKQGTAKTPVVNTINIYNLPPDVITTLSNPFNFYIQIQAGYLYDEGSVNTHDDLPVVYLGSIITTNTNRSTVDVVTTLQCTPFNDRAAKAKSNRTFTAGTSVKAVFNYLATTLTLPVQHYWSAQNTTFLQKDRIVEGSTLSVINDWCERYNLRMVTDKGVIKIIDKAVKHASSFRHKIPLDRIKGYPSTTIDASKVLKEGTTPVSDVSFKTFLFPRVSLNDSVSIDLIDYTAPQVLGKYKVSPQDFIVNSYTHAMDSHEGNVWDTTITGKGEQTQ